MITETSLDLKVTRLVKARKTLFFFQTEPLKKIVKLSSVNLLITVL